MPRVPRILAFAGSVRRDSLNRKLLAATVDAVREAGAEATTISLGDFPLPLYDGDLEAAEGVPENALRLVRLMREHDGFLIASPEYNSQLTPLLKNTIDWCSRADDDPFEGRAAAVVSASPGNFGAIRSMTLLRALLTHLGCHTIPAQCVLPLADKAFAADGGLIDARARKASRAVAQELVRVAAALKAGA